MPIAWGKKGVLVKVIVLQRHANTVHGENDALRELTDLGRTQAAAMQEKLITMGLGDPDVVASSTAQRALSTVAPCMKRTIALPQLYLSPPGPDADEQGRLFKALGYSPLRAYLADDPTESIKRWAVRAHTEVERCLRGASLIRICGHAIMLPALALEIIPEEYRKARDTVLDVALDEACCLLIYELDDGGFRVGTATL